MTLRELWWLACGAYDRDLLGRKFWLEQNGNTPTQDQLLEMHPLRRREKAKTRDATSEPKPMTTAEQALFDELTGG